MHSPCENKLYSDISGKPCFPEEVGILGPMVCDETTEANFLKATAYQAWLNGNIGFMWWCANEQSHLETAPYAWNMMERELGLFDRNGLPKPSLLKMKEISERIGSFDFKPTSPKEDIVCITSIGQDNWGISYMAYSLARSLNLQLKFAYPKYEIPKADKYMLPSFTGYESLPREQYFELKKRVYEGATLYLSMDEGFLSEFSEFCGVKVRDTKVVNEQCELELSGKKVKLERSWRREIEAVGAKVLAYDNLGIPAFTEFKYGKGTVYYLNFPMEKNLLAKQNAFAGDYAEVYALVYKDIIDNQPIKVDNPNVKTTFYNDVNKAVLFNYSDEKQKVVITDKNGKVVDEVECEPFDVCIVDIK